MSEATRLAGEKKEAGAGGPFGVIILPSQTMIAPKKQEECTETTTHTSRSKGETSVLVGDREQIIL